MDMKTLEFYTDELMFLYHLMETPKVPSNTQRFEPDLGLFLSLGAVEDSHHSNLFIPIELERNINGHAFVQVPAHTSQV